MSGERLLRILSLITSGGAAPPTTGALCEVGVGVAAVTGGSLMLVSGDTQRGSLHATDDVSASLEELQFMLGEGPCLDAHREGRPVLAPDLEEDGEGRWPGFTPDALALGARAVFGFPMVVGATRLGALKMQADTPPGILAGDLAEGANFHLVVHQASGMVSVQLGVDVVEALVRIRAFAFAEGRLLGEVAAAVVRRELRFGALGADGDTAP
jgi:hypothetical protein